jgi:hypothetical protein
MLRLLIVTVLLSLLCHKSCVGRPTNTVDTPHELGWQAWLLVDPGTPKPHNEEVKKRRITPKSVFIAPAFSGTSHLPDCAEGYRPDSMGRCVKLVQLNHAAQLNFLLQRLNAMYATPTNRRGYEDSSASDSSSTGPFQVSIPIDISPESEEVTEESVEVAVVMADVLEENKQKNNNKTDETQKSQTIVAVLNVGKNGTSLEEMDTSGDLEMESDKLHHEEGNLKLLASNATKYEIVKKNGSSSVPKESLSAVDEEQLLTTTPISVVVSEDSDEPLLEQMKAPDSAMELLEEVGSSSSENGRPANTSRRNVSDDEEARKEAATQTVPIIIEPVAVNVSATKHDRKTANNECLSQTDAQPKIKAKTNVILTSTYRPSAFVRYPAESSAAAGGHNMAVSNRVHADEMRHLINSSQRHFDYSKPLPTLPSDVHQRQIYWWLPPGWRLDPTRHQPMLIRFWARMPLLRDDHSGTTYSHQDTYKSRRRGPLVY